MCTRLFCTERAHVEWLNENGFRTSEIQNKQQRESSQQRNEIQNKSFIQLACVI